MDESESVDDNLRHTRKDILTGHESPNFIREKMNLLQIERDRFLELSKRMLLERIQTSFKHYIVSFALVRSVFPKEAEFSEWCHDHLISVERTPEGDYSCQKE